MKTIFLDDICKKYKTKRKEQIEPLSCVNLEIGLGEELAIVGKSGVGKTSLLNIISFLDKPTSGHYYLNGQDTVALNDKKKAMLRNSFFGIIMQEYALIEHMTVYENVAIPLEYSQKKISKKQRKEKVREVLEKLGILEKIDEPVTSLSGGQRQRVAIARAIVNEPVVIVADEPTAALDDENKWDVIELLRTLKNDDRILIIVTHDRDISSKMERVFDLENI